MIIIKKDYEISDSIDSLSGIIRLSIPIFNEVSTDIDKIFSFEDVSLS
jgi:hypothetical protein